jgi:hypothetical protein
MSEPAFCCACTRERGLAASHTSGLDALARERWASQARRELSAFMTRGVRAPLHQPALLQGLDSWYLEPGVLDRGKAGFDAGVFDAAFRYVQTCRFDARYDLSGGANGYPVLHSSTTHPRPYRIEFGVCHSDCQSHTQRPNSSLLVSYSAQGIPAHLWSKRHMPPPIFMLVAHVCTVLRPHVPQLELAESFPNSVTVHWYPSERTPGNSRGNTRVGFHSDSYSAHGSRVAQREGTPVLSISWGECMWFWARRDTAEWVVTPLEHGSVWIWSSRDDKSGVKHSVQYPKACEHPRDVRLPSGCGRWVIVCRWLDSLREHDQDFPFRNLSGRGCVWL